MFDKELMKQLTTIPVQNREEWFAERDKLETLAVEMTRINAKDMVQKYGIARVLNLPLNLNDSDVSILILDENNCNLWIKLAFMSARGRLNNYSICII